MAKHRKRTAAQVEAAWEAMLEETTPKRRQLRWVTQAECSDSELEQLLTVAEAKLEADPFNKPVQLIAWCIEAVLWQRGLDRRAAVDRYKEGR